MVNNNDKCCGTCGNCVKDELNDLICVEDKSDYCADYVDYEFVCELWEEVR